MPNNVHDGTFRPKEAFTTAAELYAPTKTVVKGTTKKEWTKVDNIFCSFKTYGGTENIENNVLTVIDTATILTWYRPEIKADCRIVVAGRKYEILGEPEDISLRHQYIRFKARAVKGGA